MSKQTLCTARKNLARRGLISFTDGKSRHVPSKYSLLEWTNNLTVELTDGLTADVTLLKDKEKDSFTNKGSINFSNNKNVKSNGYDTQNRRRGVKEVSTETTSYEGSF